ncbi:Serine/threonine-protein kinase/endoribonuclease IRE1a [Raphanus sativus]|uniref:non-specific serine/threonine protein kinase n=1 Tax=Raphanus sativus TaxID=3726 RepID=A0A6J0P7S5_RAPSA|nr:serine/threonine-protein kinase/endoribonuclease IRE1a [Raphanus sativus]KAJ4897073.1 Serine/threonine-protein kinase/endoribonuclease IRE1a [Raphanus sativus]
MMTPCHFLFLLLSLLLSPWTSSLAAESSNLISLYGRAATRSLLSSEEPNTELVVDLSGKVSLIMHPSNKPIWSFSSGSPIHSSYQAPLTVVNNTDNATELSKPFVIEYIENSEVVTTADDDDVYTRKTMEDLLTEMPRVTDDGLTLGSKTSTTYLVDALSGRLLHVYKTTQSSSSGDNNNNKNNNVMVKPTSADDLVNLQLLITRTDSKLEHFDKTSSQKPVWNVTVSRFRADLRCDLAFNKDNKNLGPEILTGVYMPLRCGGDHTDIRALVGSGVYIRVPRDRQVGGNEEARMLLPSAAATRESRKLWERDVFAKSFGWSPVKLLVPLFALCAVVVISVLLKRSSSSGGDLNSKSGPSRKKKNRKSRQSEFELIEGGEMLLGFSDTLADGRKIGKLFVSNREIAKGSNGTVVFEGVYEGRAVAVKRLVRSHHEVAFKEIQNLIASDQHSNIIRWYGVEYDRDFVYLSLERCACSLDDLIKTCLNVSMTTKALGNSGSTEGVAAYEIKVEDSLEGVVEGNSLWKVGGHPSPLMLKLMRDIVFGLAHLHELGIVHRDLKPQNVLISKGMSLSAKLSDMGISKRLTGDMSSLGHFATGCGSSGWQAPEQLLQGRQTRAVDMFSLGCILFYSITGCKHPYGDDLERDVNIVKNKVDLFLVEHVPEASDLISRLLNPNPDLRPSATEVLLHPMFWNSEMRLSFLRDASDRVELENREADSEILKAMESTAPVAIGGKWDEKLEPIFITNIGRYRRYKYDSIRDLLRVIRNKLNHHRELPSEIQELVGTVPEGFDEYFTVRFPKLLIEVYRVISVHCKEEEVFRKYFKCNNI